MMITKLEVNDNAYQYTRFQGASVWAKIVINKINRYSKNSKLSTNEIKPHFTSFNAKFIYLIIISYRLHKLAY